MENCHFIEKVENYLMLSEYEQNLSKVVTDIIIIIVITQTLQKNHKISLLLWSVKSSKNIFRRPRAHTWDGEDEGEAEMKYSEKLVETAKPQICFIRF